MQLGQRVRALSGTSAASRPKRAGSVSVRAAAAAKRDAKQRIVITGIGICSVHGNDPDVFYSKLLDGVSGISTIDRFDAKDFPTRFGGQIRNFDDEGGFGVLQTEAVRRPAACWGRHRQLRMIDKKNARRYDDCIKYTMVSGKKALVMAGLEKERNSEGHKNLDLTRVGVLVSGVANVALLRGPWNPATDSAAAAGFVLGGETSSRGKVATPDRCNLCTLEAGKEVYGCKRRGGHNRHKGRCPREEQPALGGFVKKCVKGKGGWQLLDD
ncbi:3-oxoacyl-[acyl-carrier-protein] synthase I, chloroplastic [Tetrabaena socialis]|uniref:beta-ketoacyl-[acyl-carrier-protein] synthase I n=1 Tax=Tetrabaena socialis TaxID=47790 RepID=A0A2J8A336_9CHLO|nr:3-oxoacyl-[acyl-carrier-protein] synthase I, chloroplastic [Tetrabaena socialis]|eukprot:PNH06929.1 3-oxoacyl-[acyl-carrier-protein] synthase I, chloroplastic [Tetrabaena socialis]